MNQTNKDLFEARLIAFMLSLPAIDGDIDRLSEVLAKYTQKDVSSKSLFFMSKSQGYAKKWLLMAMLEYSLKSGWMPASLKDWENIVWTLTGKKQSVLGGDNQMIYQQLADIADKPEISFQQNFDQLREGAYGQGT